MHKNYKPKYKNPKYITQIHKNPSFVLLHQHKTTTDMPFTTPLFHPLKNSKNKTQHT